MEIPYGFSISIRLMDRKPAPPCIRILFPGAHSGLFHPIGVLIPLHLWLRQGINPFGFAKRASRTLVSIPVWSFSI